MPDTLLGSQSDEFCILAMHRGCAYALNENPVAVKLPKCCTKCFFDELLECQITIMSCVTR